MELSNSRGRWGWERAHALPRAGGSAGGLEPAAGGGVEWSRSPAGLRVLGTGVERTPAAGRA